VALYDLTLQFPIEVDEEGVCGFHQGQRIIYPHPKVGYMEAIFIYIS